MVEDFKHESLAASLAKLPVVAREVAFQQVSEHRADRGRKRIAGSQNVWVPVELRVKRQQEGVVVRRRAEAIDELRQEADDDDARVEAGKILDVMKLQIIDDEKIARCEFDEVVAHAEARGAVEWEEKFKPLVPRRAARVTARGVTEELDDKWKLAVERLAVASCFIK
jgi:hypothetical protein